MTQLYSHYHNEKQSICLVYLSSLRWIFISLYSLHNYMTYLVIRFLSLQNQQMLFYGDYIFCIFYWFLDVSLVWIYLQLFLYLIFKFKGLISTTFLTILPVLHLFFVTLYFLPSPSSFFSFNWAFYIIFLLFLIYQSYFKKSVGH